MTPFETALLACVRLVLGSETDVYWRDKSSAWRNDGLSVALQYVSRVRVGVDEKRYTTENETTERIYGNRVATVQITVDCNEQGVAHDTADTLSAGFSFTSVEDRLALINVSAARPGPVIQDNYTDKHGDVRSVAVFEVVFNTARIVEGAIVGTIAQAEVTGEVDEETTIGPGLVPETV